MQLSIFDFIKRRLPVAGDARSAESPPANSPRVNSVSANPVPASPVKAEPVQREARIAPLHRGSPLKRLWLAIRREWFPNRPDLDCYTVEWSKRSQKRTLASCNIESKRVIVARELNYPEQHRWLKPLLYHEMCHAYLGFSVVDQVNRSRWHGKEFKALERRYPGMPEFDRWVNEGGWERAVRSDRAKRAHRRRRINTIAGSWRDR